MNKTTVIHHSADYDGIFCREIAKHFLGTESVEYIGWDFPDKPLPIPTEGPIIIMDLPVDRVFGVKFPENISHGDPTPFPWLSKVIWIDHHKSSIETHPQYIPGYRIDGVAACRLAWQWFNLFAESDGHLPRKQDFIDRTVLEPLAVTLAGEYDVWEHAKSNNMDVAFQFGLDSGGDLMWSLLLGNGEITNKYVTSLVNDGVAAMRCYAKRDADIVTKRSFLVEFEGLMFLVLNTARANSNTYAALDKPETGHDGLMAFHWNGKDWNFSLYHAAHRKDIDLSVIAKKHGGGGHRGACGFRCDHIQLSAESRILQII